ncbi:MULTISPECIES: hypothetical protein [Legionella]|uniref:Type IV secretion protein IcmL n=1 Tax=Legionella septentrionalis TaxID=2498109 RepID=A0A3S1CL65_9GAMM|nr:MULTISPECIES: hypothetical protein [Legionella]MCP0913866.1 hypothetical protein [Legionella sp. 27cVA30]RUQ85266.1 hypothetical protein EKM59_06950 [Legionella septentrionalis]RUQ98709.1 hypothetical protein ELY11_05350 [Legionella septentrionalis]RUR09918.1 hypothetical protein ELY14_06895 [Legionella septentrionalis]
MKQKVVSTLFLIILTAIFIFPLPSHANDDEVMSWARQTLVETLSIDGKIDPKLTSNYSLNAWNALNTFLNSLIRQTRAQNLTLHPLLDGPGNLVQSGTVQHSNFFTGIRFWRVQQAVAIPEVDKNIIFTLLIIRTTENKFVITSLDMVWN